MHDLDISMPHPYSTYGATMEFTIYGDYTYRWWAEMGHSGRTGNFGVLGAGWICHHCGDYNPSGCVTCLKCGGMTQEAFVRPLAFDFYVCEIAGNPVIASLGDDLSLERVTIECAGDHVIDALYAGLFSERSFFKANGYNLESGYYLCQYCGFGVREGDTCPGCGGKRIPYSEIVRLNRKCVYCGRESLGNLVCEGCGARIKGTTFKQARLV